MFYFLFGLVLFKAKKIFKTWSVVHLRKAVMDGYMQAKID